MWLDDALEGVQQQTRRMTMTDADVPQEAERETTTNNWVARVGADWWATLLGLAITALAVAGALPKIPW